MARYRCVEDGSEVECAEPPLGAGGEGTVHATNRPGLVAKIYHPHRQPVHRMIGKLKYMRDNPPEQPPSDHGHIAITWPRALLENRGRICGFLLDESRGESMDKAMNPRERKTFFPGQTWRFSLAVAHNLAWVVEKLHQKGFVIGDVNTQNLRVLPDGQVSIIDTDSFQFREPGNGGALHPCGVMTPEYAAPELTAEIAKAGRRTPEQDAFALAVVVYGLLVCGKHPFNGVYTGPGEPPDTREAILKGYSVFHPDAPFSRTPKGPTPAFLPGGVQRRFTRCFVAGAKKPGERPGAAEWRRALWELANGTGLGACAHNPFHVYPTEGGVCVWCAWARAMRYDYYDPHFKVTASQPNRPRNYQPAAPLPAVTQLRVSPVTTIPKPKTLPRATTTPHSRPLPVQPPPPPGPTFGAPPIHRPFIARPPGAAASFVVPAAKVRDPCFDGLRVAAAALVLLAVFWLLLEGNRMFAAFRDRLPERGRLTSTVDGVLERTRPPSGNTDPSAGVRERKGAYE